MLCRGTEGAQQMADAILEVRDLRKQYAAKDGTVDAVKGISFRVENGEIFEFLGANGAGKSTTINMITTQLLPSGGKIILDGQTSPETRRRSAGGSASSPSTTIWNGASPRRRTFSSTASTSGWTGTSSAGGPRSC